MDRRVIAINPTGHPSLLVFEDPDHDEYFFGINHTNMMIPIRKQDAQELKDWAGVKE